MLARRSIIVCALIVACAVAPARATGSLSFEGGGYWIDLEVGHTDVPVIASARLYRPGDARGVVLPREQLHVDVFDTRRQVLVLRFIGSGTVEPFILVIDGVHATLQIGAQRIDAPFRWLM
jgi:hypothetical protein